ncbi:MAG: phosphotransferase family protein [Burkholderiaceae bacterium]|nr:phosphotransferase family protein [Burkholderiaceae bacterium]
MTESAATLAAQLQPLVEEACAQTGRRLQLKDARLLSGGAINQNFLLELTDAQGAAHRWVMRRGQSQPIPGTLGREAEFDMVTHAFAMGVRVAQPIAHLADRSPSVSFFLWCQGKTDPRALLAWATGKGKGAEHRAEAQHQAAVQALTQDLGAQLALLHGRSSAIAAHEKLSAHIGQPAADGIAACSNMLTKSFSLVRQPASYLSAAYAHVMREFESVAAARAERFGRMPAACLCHHDYRLGNLMIDTQHAAVTAVLDWEFAHWGDPMADIGWLTAPCWRFGGTAPVAGFGRIEDLLQGYACAGGENRWSQADLAWAIEQEVSFWQRFAHLRWAIIAAQQGERAVSGESEALELRITGAMVASILEPVLAHYWTAGENHTGGSHGALASSAALPELGADHHGLDVLLAEAALHLRNHLGPQLSGSARYSALMSANAIRLARAALRAAQISSGLSASGSEQLAREELQRDLAIWGFRG